MTETRFALARHLRDTRAWDFFMMVEMGTDRIHHAFWRYLDPEHPDYEPGNPFESGDPRLLPLRRRRDRPSCWRASTTTRLVLVVSDHGAQAMDGGIQVNEWLMREGYLVLKEQPAAPIPIGKARSTGRDTRLGPTAATTGRLFLNVAGPRAAGHGRPPEEYEALRDELIAKLEALGDEQGGRSARGSSSPRSSTARSTGSPPDLIVYFGNLTWRAVGTRRQRPRSTSRERHRPRRRQPRQDGHLHLAGPGMPQAAPTARHALRHRADRADALGMPVPADMRGRPL